MKHKQECTLSKIRAEIEQRPYGVDNDSMIHGAKIQGMQCERAAILKIIDKYRVEPVLDKVRNKLIQSIQNGTIKIEDENEELFNIIDKYRENEEED